MAIGDLFRLARAGWIMAREGVLTMLQLPEPVPVPFRMVQSMARLIERPRAHHRDASERLTIAFNRLGPSFIKMGQFLGTRPDVVGRDLADALAGLRDNVPAFGEMEARRVIEEAFGCPIEKLFVTISPPIAAASIAQVHKAEWIDSSGQARSLAIKVLRPGVAQRFEKDLRSFYTIARLAERLVPKSRRLKPVAVVDTLARSIALEMDFRLEAAALSEMAEQIAGDEGFRVPEVIWERSAKTVLAMEWVDGIKMADVEAIRASGLDMPKLAREIIQHFLRHALRDGFFHADMHQGNLFVGQNGTIVAVDLGIMGRLGLKERRFLAEILYGFITRNYLRVAEVHFEAGYVPPTQDVMTFAQALRAIGEPLQGHTAAEISMARLLTQLFEVTELFEMSTRPELIMLQKTMVVVEGVARTLDPHLNMWHTADPVVRQWIERNLGPLGKIEDGLKGLSALVSLSHRLPQLVERADELAAAARRPVLVPARRRTHWLLVIAAYAVVAELAIIAARLW